VKAGRAQAAHEDHSRLAERVLRGEFLYGANRCGGLRNPLTCVISVSLDYGLLKAHVRFPHRD